MNREFLSRAYIQLVVQLTLSALSRCDLRACVIGGVAALIHGIEYRDPKDVDLLILNAGVGQDAEEIKRILVEKDSSHFSLTPSRAAGATHRILWCTLNEGCLDDPPLTLKGHEPRPISRGGGTPNASRTNATRACKIDILNPHQLYMTHVSESQLYRDPANTFMAYFSDSEPQTHVPISYVPLSILLMLKLRAWVDHCLPSANEVKHGKIPQDEDDIQEILRVGRQDGNLASINHRGLMDDEIWTLGGFASGTEAEQAVGKFVNKWPRTANGWRAVGFS